MKMAEYFAHVEQLKNPPRAEGPVAHYSAGRNYYPQRYVIGWSDGIVKVGSTWNGKRRWGRFTSRGGVMLDLAYYGPEHSDVDAESWLQHQMAKRYRRAFNSSGESTQYLGSSGSGYLECYAIPPEKWPEIIELARTEDALV